MGTIPTTTFSTLPPGVLALAGDARAEPDPAAKVQALTYQTVLERDTLGTWGADKGAQTNHNTGVISIAVKAYTDAMGAAKVNVLEHKVAANQLKSGSFLKSTSGEGHYSRDDEYEPLDSDHPLCKVIENPGGEDGVWSMHQECAYLAMQYLLTGDAPAWTPCNDANKPVRFFALTAALVTPQIAAGVSAQYPKGAYRVQPYSGGFYGGSTLLSQAILPGEEVARFREPHPWSRQMGYSRLQAGVKEIDVLEAITASRWAYFDSGLQLDAVALLPGADTDVVEAFQKSLTQKVGGAKNARRFAVIGGAGISDKWDLKTYGQTARDLDYQTGYDQSASVVMALLRVPKIVGGLDEGANYAQDWAAQKRFYDLGISPFCRGFSVFLTQALAKPWSDHPGQYKIEVEAAVPKNVESEEKEREFAVTNDLITVNQYLKATGRKPVPDGDVPLSAYRAKFQPQQAPEQVNGKPGDSQQGASADPLAALLGGKGGASTPTGGKPPQPANPQAAGSLPPRATKALDCGVANTLEGSAGGFLVEPGNRLRRKKKKRASAVSARVLKGLETTEGE